MPRADLEKKKINYFLFIINIFGNIYFSNGRHIIIINNVELRSYYKKNFKYFFMQFYIILNL